MNDTLTIEYDEFPVEGDIVLSVVKDDVVINMFWGNDAKMMYNLLQGFTCSRKDDSK